MAYKTFSGSTFFSLDGVPFIVSEKWKPPKKVTLPLKFETGNPSEVLFLEYDSTTEENFLAHLEAERELEKAAASVATAAAAVDSATAKPANEVASAAVKYCSPSGQGNHLSHVDQDQQSRLQSSMQPGVTPSAVVPKRSSAPQMAPSSQTHAAYHVMNGNILMPTPIAASGESVLHGAIKAMNNFDLTDFENENDPFENLSLKVINDIEELDKVFLATSRSQSTIGSSSHGEQKTSPTEAVNLETSQQQREQQHFQQQQQQFPSDCVVHTNTSAVFPLDGLNASQHLQEKVNAKNPLIASTQGAAVFYPSLPCSTALTSYMNSSNTVSSGSSSNAWLPSTHLPVVGLNYETRIPDSILTDNLMSSVLQPKHKALTSDKTALSFSVQTPSSVASSSAKQISMDNGFLYGHAWPLEASGSPWPPVAPPGYHGPSQDSSQVPLQYDHSRMSCTSNLPLRSAKSNPDLSVADASVGGASVWYGRHTPPIFDTRSQSTKPDRTYINQAPGARNHAPSLSSSVGLPHSQNVGLHSEKINQQSGEENLYSCLSDEAQSFVVFIAAMGFPQLQTIRAVEKLGIDEKMVLDHLCSYSKLIEKGYNPRDAENALFLFDGDMNKAEDYAKLASNFRAMGFEEEKISTALVKCSLDGELSLDWLTS